MVWVGGYGGGLDQSKNGVKEEDVVSDIAKLEELPKEEKA
ncbi:hypothetical protein Godav_002680 [Gossypium davidsonii]|uniref:Uncharacterized protein n=1 Tax=Gossypium davidsonii TaxID=34287 RepID=A0A7J8SYK2_GOSDV|nr:hypothetical protein [Gossypium davidsonii]